MPRVRRQGRRCSARRTDGRPCKAFAIVGGWVCAAHGGSSPKVRRAAQLRVYAAKMNRAVDLAIERHREEFIEWQVVRVLTAARVLDMPPEVVARNPALLGLAHARGAIPSIDEAPKLRVDRRYVPRVLPE